MQKPDIPAQLLYSTGDEWVRREGARTIVGITDYAQQQLGDIVFVELPELGSTVEKGEPCGVVESVKAAADLFAPISGEVVEINRALEKEPEAVNEDCYGEGWMVALEATDPEEFDALLSADAYQQHCQQRE